MDIPYNVIYHTKGVILGIYKSKEEANAQVPMQPESQKREEMGRHLRRTIEVNAPEAQIKSDDIDKPVVKKHTKVGKIATAVAFAGAFSMVSTMPFTIAAVTTGALGTGAVFAIDTGLFAAGTVSAFVAYGVLIYERLSQKIGHRKESEA